MLCLLLPPAKGVVGFCCASWPCLSSWSCSTWVFIHSVSGDWLLLGGFSCWLFLLAGSQGCALLPLALVAFRLQGWTGGGGGGAPSSGPSGFRSWNRLLPAPFLTVVCPSIGRPGGTGVRSLGGQWCCGSAIVCPLSAPLHFSMLRSLYFLTAPLPSRVLLWRSSPWPSLPWVQWSLLLSLLQGFFYSRLFAMWLSSGSWRPVMTLSHLLCFCDSVSISDGAHSVCAPVSMSGDWMAYLVLLAAFLQVPVHPASRHLLRFLF